MPDYIVYHASSPDEIHECAYCLLKYLELYNLKPPVHHQWVIYTTEPAKLEVYGSFIQHFELNAISPATASKWRTLEQFLHHHSGPVLYLGGPAYPVEKLEGLFNSIRNGKVFRSGTAVKDGSADLPPVLGLAAGHDSLSSALRSGALDPHPFIAQYEDLKEFPLLLNYFFKRNSEESVPNQVKGIHHVDACTIQQQKLRFIQQPFYVRWMKKAMGRGWDIGKYTARM